MKDHKLLHEWQLIKLLNDYEKEINNGEMFYWDEQNIRYLLSVPLIISKQYGFIRWLDEKEKIDRKKLSEHPLMLNTTYYLSWEFAIMVLATTNDPIDYLASIIR